MSAARTKAQGIIDNSAVAVFSKSYCPYCKATKELLSKLGAKYEVTELDQIGASDSPTPCIPQSRMPYVQSTPSIRLRNRRTEPATIQASLTLTRS